MIFHDWLRHYHAWVVTPWKYNCEKVSWTARVAQYILHSNFYDIYSSSEMVDYGCCLTRILIDLAVINRDTCSRSTRPLPFTRLFKKMQRMSVRDLDKMETFHEKKVFRYTPSKETTTIWVKQPALRLVDRLAHDVPQSAEKEGYMPFHPFHRQLQSHVLCFFFFFFFFINFFFPQKAN